MAGEVWGLGGRQDPQREAHRGRKPNTSPLSPVPSWNQLPLPWQPPSPVLPRELTPVTDVAYRQGEGQPGPTVR